MKRYRKMLSAVMAAAFALNSVAADVALGQEAFFKVSGDKLAPASVYGDLNGIEHKDMARIKQALELNLKRYDKAGTLRLTDIVKAGGKPVSVFNPPDMQFMFSEKTVLKDGRYISVRCRIDDRYGRRDYHAVFQTEKDKRSGFHIEVCKEDERDKLIAAIEKYDVLPGRRGADAIAIERYIEHEKNLDSFLAKKRMDIFQASHLVCNRYLKLLLTASPSFVSLKSHLTNLGVKEANAKLIMQAIEERELIFVRANLIGAGPTYERPVIHMPDEKGVMREVGVDSHTSNNAIWIIVPENYWEQLKNIEKIAYNRSTANADFVEAGENARHFTDFFREKLLYEVGPICGLEGTAKDKSYSKDGAYGASNIITEARELMGHPFLGSDRDVQRKLTELKARLSDIKPVNLDMDLKRRDYASADADRPADGADAPAADAAQKPPAAGEEPAPKPAAAGEEPARESNAFFARSAKADVLSRLVDLYNLREDVEMKMAGAAQKLVAFIEEIKQHANPAEEAEYKVGYGYLYKEGLKVMEELIVTARAAGEETMDKSILENGAKAFIRDFDARIAVRMTKYYALQGSADDIARLGGFSANAKVDADLRKMAFDTLEELAVEKGNHLALEVYRVHFSGWYKITSPMWSWMLSAKNGEEPYFRKLLHFAAATWNEPVRDKALEWIGDIISNDAKAFQVCWDWKSGEKERDKLTDLRIGALSGRISATRRLAEIGRKTGIIKEGFRAIKGLKEALRLGNTYAPKGITEILDAAGYCDEGIFSAMAALASEAQAGYAPAVEAIADFKTREAADSLTLTAQDKLDLIDIHKRLRDFRLALDAGKKEFVQPLAELIKAADNEFIRRLGLAVLKEAADKNVIGAKEAYSEFVPSYDIKMELDSHALAIEQGLNKEAIARVIEIAETTTQRVVKNRSLAVLQTAAEGGSLEALDACRKLIRNFEIKWQIRQQGAKVAATGSETALEWLAGFVRNAKALALKHLAINRLMITPASPAAARMQNIIAKGLFPHYAAMLKLGELREEAAQGTGREGVRGLIDFAVTTDATQLRRIALTSIREAALKGSRRALMFLQKRVMETTGGYREASGDINILVSHGYRGREDAAEAIEAEKLLDELKARLEKEAFTAKAKMELLASLDWLYTWKNDLKDQLKAGMAISNLVNLALKDKSAQVRSAALSALQEAAEMRFNAAIEACRRLIPYFSDIQELRLSRDAALGGDEKAIDRIVKLAKETASGDVRKDALAVLEDPRVCNISRNARDICYRLIDSWDARCRVRNLGAQAIEGSHDAVAELITWVAYNKLHSAFALSYLSRPEVAGRFNAAADLCRERIKDFDTKLRLEILRAGAMKGGDTDARGLHEEYGKAKDPEIRLLALRYMREVLEGSDNALMCGFLMRMTIDSTEPEKAAENLIAIYNARFRRARFAEAYMDNIRSCWEAQAIAQDRMPRGGEPTIDDRMIHQGSEGPFTASEVMTKLNGMVKKGEVVYAHAYLGPDRGNSILFNAGDTKLRATPMVLEEWYDYGVFHRFVPQIFKRRRFWLRHYAGMRAAVIHIDYASADADRPADGADAPATPTAAEELQFAVGAARTGELKSGQALTPEQKLAMMTTLKKLHDLAFEAEMGAKGALSDFTAALKALSDNNNLFRQGVEILAGLAKKGAHGAVKAGKDILPEFGLLMRVEKLRNRALAGDKDAIRRLAILAATSRAQAVKRRASRYLLEIAVETRLEEAFSEVKQLGQELEDALDLLEHIRIAETQYAEKPQEANRAIKWLAGFCRVTRNETQRNEALATLALFSDRNDSAYSVCKELMPDRFEELGRIRRWGADASRNESVAAARNLAAFAATATKDATLRSHARKELMEAARSANPAAIRAMGNLMLSADTSSDAFFEMAAVLADLSRSADEAAARVWSDVMSALNGASVTPESKLNIMEQIEDMIIFFSDVIAGRLESAVPALARMAEREKDLHARDSYIFILYEAAKRGDKAAQDACRRLMPDYDDLMTVRSNAAAAAERNDPAAIRAVIKVAESTRSPRAREEALEALIIASGSDMEAYGACRRLMPRFDEIWRRRQWVLKALTGDRQAFINLVDAIDTTSDGDLRQATIDMALTVVERGTVAGARLDDLKDPYHESLKRLKAAGRKALEGDDGAAEEVMETVRTTDNGSLREIGLRLLRRAALKGNNAAAIRFLGVRVFNAAGTDDYTALWVDLKVLLFLATTGDRTAAKAVLDLKAALASSAFTAEDKLSFLETASWLIGLRKTIMDGAQPGKVVAAVLDSITTAEEKGAPVEMRGIALENVRIAADRGDNTALEACKRLIPGFDEKAKPKEDKVITLGDDEYDRTAAAVKEWGEAALKGDKAAAIDLINFSRRTDNEGLRKLALEYMLKSVALAGNETALAYLYDNILSSADPAVTARYAVSGGDNSPRYHVRR